MQTNCELSRKTPYISYNGQRKTASNQLTELSAASILSKFFPAFKTQVYCLYAPAFLISALVDDTTSPVLNMRRYI